MLFRSTHEFTAARLSSGSASSRVSVAGKTTTTTKAKTVG